ncbi:chemotaxis protein CheA [Paenibacillus riograndensis]|uniref:Chemotaxis protein CheA n=1 Tax=Paenibacillus riograndensis SBR5 TaxID=1073571 RepID=A0A0E4HCE8_9BACL|nr:chemotaxis protein CheA [Paenibacillus riograndensis]CQR56706.1 CheA signal transduction histidine kinase [Paenibacillus riograndensis SBR5]
MMELSAYRDIFIEELNDQLERMDQSLLALEQSPSAELIQTIFRAAHTIKGSSSTMGFKEMSDLTHEVEFILEWVREKKPEITSVLIDTLFRALDAMKLLRTEYISGSEYTNCSSVVSEIKALLGKPAEPERNRLPLPVLSAAETLLAESAVGAGEQLIAVSITLKEDCLMKAARHFILLQRMEAVCGTVIAVSLFPASAPGTDEDDRYGRFTVVAATMKEQQQIQDQLGDDSDIQSLDIAPFKLKQSKEAEKIEHAPEASTQQGNPKAEERGKGMHPTVRVNVERLDHLMNLVGELLIEQTSLADLSAAGQRSDPARVLPDISSVSDHMGSIIKELQDGVMKTRMLPIDQLFSRFPRLVRDLAQKLDKDIELVIQGGETELDRMIIEELSDPLIHLIRNSADHGIESPGVRISEGKPAKGRITLTSFHEENHVVIRLEDDGQGIDASKIKASALGKGIITEEQAGYLTAQEAVHLIFEPGFSTASAVSEVSGRGVGMDIVRSQIGRLNGIIDIETEPGKGTVFTIRLPLTLAIIKGLLVKVAGRVLILPMYNVAEIVRIAPEEIQVVQGEQAIINHGRIVPLSWLRDKLHYPRAERSTRTIPLVIVRSVDKIAAFAVDEIIGNQEVVIKSLGAYLGTLNHLSGATILGNGRVALILDAAYLVSH